MVLAQRIDGEHVEILVDKYHTVTSPEFEVYPGVPPEGFVGSIFIVVCSQNRLTLLINGIPKVLWLTDE